MSKDAMAKRWYVVNTYSGYENRVKELLQERIKLENKEDLFGEILVPSENVVELVKGQKKTSSRKFFPGYILVNMELNDETWHIVKNTPKVTGFVGEGMKPTPITDGEIEEIMNQMAQGVLRPKPKTTFEKGDSVRITDGPFTNFNGMVDEVKPEKGRLRVMVSIFGRSTPIELDFFQVKKN
jgi:transcriptional antiterminator NusG